MRNTTRLAMILAVLATAVGCGRPTAEPAAAGEPLAVQVLEFAGDGSGRPVAALSDRPIALSVFAGWYGQADIDEEPRPGVAEPGRTYLAVATSTGCRVATGVEVRRSGDDLRVAFTGGDDPPECVRGVGPAAVLSLATADLVGVRTVDGRAPVAPEPGRLTGFVPLGGLSVEPLAAEFGPGVAAPLHALASVNAEGRAALERPVPAGSRGFAIVVSGCRETGAVLLVNNSWIKARATGGEGVACYAPESYLATFEVPADVVPERAELPGSL